MNKAKVATLLLSVASTTLLAGCGGGSSGSTSEGSNSQTITAIDGYLQNAEIYLDGNENGILDPSEQTSGPIGTTNASGSIVVSDLNFGSTLLVRAVAGETIDSDSGIVDTTYVLSAPKGSAFITPFTHIAQKTGKTLAQLAEDLGLDESLISGDYIDQKADTDAVASEKASIAHALARFVVRETKKGTAESTVSSSLGDAKLAVESAITAGRNADLVELDLQTDGGINSDAPTTALKFEKAALKDTNWSMFRFDDAGDNEHFFIRFGSANNPDAICFENEAFGFLDKTIGIAAPTSDCIPDGTFDVNAEGNLVWRLADESGSVSETELVMLHRFTDSGYSMFLMVADNGELFWVDNNPTLKDAGDYKIEESVTTYSFRDDSPDRGAIDYFLIESTYTVNGNANYTVSGQPETLNTGDLVLSALNRPGSAVTTFETLPLYEKTGQMQTSDDIVITVENVSADSEEHWYFPYRSAGTLTLVLDVKPSANNREVLFLESGSRSLMEAIFEEVRVRDSGTQGTN